MKIDYYEKLMHFLPDIPLKIEKEKIELKAKELGVIFPVGLIAFYHYFGNCSKVLNGYYDFYPLENIRIWHNGIVFGVNDENGILGIKISDLEQSEDPAVFYGDKNSETIISSDFDPVFHKFLTQRFPNLKDNKVNENYVWYSELNQGCSSFFFNIACTNILFNKPQIAKVSINRSDFYGKILNNGYLKSFTYDDNIIKKYQRCGCQSKYNGAIFVYFNLIERLFIGTDSKEDFEKISSKTGWKITNVLKTPIKNQKVSMIEYSVIENCYLSLEKHLTFPIIHLNTELIKNRANELGLVFPKSLIDFYHFFGSYNDLLLSDIAFEKLENIYISNNTLVVAHSNEGILTYGFKLDSLNDSNLCISEFSDDKCIHEIRSFSSGAFFVNAVCNNIVFSKPSVVQIKINNKYFFSKIIDKRNVYSFTDDKSLKKGFFMCGCHDESNRIIGCYVGDDMDTLFLAKFKKPCYKTPNRKAPMK